MVGLPAMKAMWGPDTLEGVASTLLLKGGRVGDQGGRGDEAFQQGRPQEQIQQ